MHLQWIRLIFVHEVMEEEILTMWHAVITNVTSYVSINVVGEVANCVSDIDAERVNDKFVAELRA